MWAKRIVTDARGRKRKKKNVKLPNRVPVERTARPGVGGVLATVSKKGKKKKKICTIFWGGGGGGSFKGRGWEGVGKVGSCKKKGKKQHKGKKGSKQWAGAQNGPLTSRGKGRNQG